MMRLTVQKIQITRVLSRRCGLLSLLCLPLDPLIVAHVEARGIVARHPSDVEIEELGVGEHGQLLVEVEVLLLLLQSDIAGGRDGVQVRDVLGHVRGPSRIVVRHGWSRCRFVALLAVALLCIGKRAGLGCGMIVESS